MATENKSKLVCFTKSLHELYPTPIGWPGADESFIQRRIDDLPKWIKCISAQALEDFSDILTTFRDNCVVLGITGDVWFEFQYLRSNSDYDKVQVDDLVEFLQRYGLTNDQYAELEEILSKKLDAALKHRLLTFFKGVRKGASSDNVEAALVYLYGDTQASIKLPKNNATSILYKLMNIFHVIYVKYRLK